jgi:hypothetical protein
MENWRRFSKDDILIETKNYNSTLEKLILEHKEKKISTTKFIDILEESIKNDLSELEKINKLLTEAGVLDKAKQLGQKAVGAVGNAINSAIKKVNDIILKASMMIYEAPKKVIPLITSAISFIKNFKQANPKMYAFLATSLKIIGLLAIAYVVLYPGTANASVEIPKLGGGTTLIDPNSADGQKLLGALQVLSPDNLQGTNLEGVDTEKLHQAVALIQKAILSKQPQKVEGALNTILNAANHLKVQAGGTDLSPTLQKLGAKVAEVASTVAEKSHETVNAAGTAGQAVSDTVSSLKDMINPAGAKAALKQYLQDNPSLDTGTGFAIDPANVIKHMIKHRLSGQDMGSLDFKNAVSQIEKQLGK